MGNSLEWLVPSEQISAPAAVVYRNRFALERKTLFRLRWTADEHADLFINGKYVADGPARGTARRWFMESLELELEPGEYVLTARVLMFGLPLTAHAQCSDSFGFYAESEQLSGDWEWQEISHVNWRPASIDWGVYPRAEVSGEANFTVLDGTGGVWKPAALRSDSRPAAENTLPPMERKKETGYHTVELAPGKILYVFDNYVCVWSDFHFSGKGSVSVRWAESFFIPGTFDRRDLIGEKGNRRVFDGKEWIGNGDIITLPGERVRWCDYWWKAGRYMLMEFSGDAVLDQVDFYSTCYPLQKEWAEKSSSPALDAAMDMAWHTLRMCSHTTFMDCPFFEQLQYVSDSRLEALCVMASGADRRLVISSLRAFADSQTACGLIASRTPSKYQQYIPSFALIYILYLNDAAQWCSPAETEEFIPCARNILRFFERERKGGLIRLPGWIYVDTPKWKEGDPAWNFLDWVDGWDNGVPPGYCSLNIFYLLALEAMEKLDPAHAGDYSRCADEIAGLVRRAYEVPGTGFAEDEARTVFSEHAQCLAVLSKRLPDYSPDIPGAAETSVSFSFYYLEAARLLNRPDLFAARLKKWFDLDRTGLCTLPENFGRPRSDCHAWSSHILYHYAASVIGLRPVNAAAGEWELKPFMAGLESAQWEFPVENGFFRVEITVSPDSPVLNCRIPSGIKLMVNGTTYRDKIENMVI